MSEISQNSFNLYEQNIDSIDFETSKNPSIISKIKESESKPYSFVDNNENTLLGRKLNRTENQKESLRALIIHKLQKRENKKKQNLFIKEKEKKIKIKSLAQIAKELECNINTVLFWKKKYETHLNLANYKKLNPGCIYEKNQKHKINEENKSKEYSIKRSKTTKKSSIAPIVRKFLYRSFKNKSSGGTDNRSINRVMAAANKKFSGKTVNIPTNKRKINQKVYKSLTYGIVQRFTRKNFGICRKIQKRHAIFNKNNIEQRKKFDEYIISNNIKGKDIFFSDEKRFVLDFFLILRQMF